MNEKQCIRFRALDSLFFREAKPFNAGEGGFLESQFPPPAQTLCGAIRTAIGEANGVDWSDKNAVATLVGGADDPAPLCFSGPYVLKTQQRLYPLPLHLLYHEPTKTWQALVPSDERYETDMGTRQLPRRDSSEDAEVLQEAKAVEGGWLDAANMQRVLNGFLPEELIPSEKIFVREARAGIGRDNLKSVVNEGQLYFSRHLRLNEQITLGMGLGGVAPWTGGRMLRLGGEGRLAHAHSEQMPMALSAPTIQGKGKGLILILLTHGDFKGKSEPDWQQVPGKLERVSACVGKPVREGGWDYAKRGPKALKALVPAGSVYFVRAPDENLAELIQQLHGTQIGTRQAFGYGEIAVGLWK